MKKEMKFKGVTKRGSKYQATFNIKFHGKTYSKYIGTFTTAKEANTARVNYLDSLK